MRSFSGLALRRVRARRARALLTAAGIVLGVGMILGVLLLAATINRTFSDLFDSVYGKTDLVVSGDGEDSLRASTLDRVSRVRGVEDLAGDVISVFTLVEGDGLASPDAEKQLNVAGQDPGAEDLTDSQTVAGREPRRGLEIALQESWAEANDVAVDDHIRLATPDGTKRFEVVGLFQFSTGLEFGGEGFAAMPLREAREVMDKRGRLDEVNVVVSGGDAEIQAVQRRLRRELPNGVEVDTPQAKGDEVESQLQAFNAILYFFAAMALFVGGFLIFNSFNMSIFQRTREIGMLRTLGASRRRIASSILIEALVLGLIGAVIGLALGVGLALALIELMRGLDFPVGDLVMTPLAPVAAIVTGLVTAVGGAFHPARRAGRTSPIRAVLGTEGLRARLRTRRAFAGVLLIGVGLAGAFWLGAAEEVTTLVAAAGMAGTIGIFFGIALVAPFVIRPLVRVLSLPLRALFPVEGRLAADAARSDPGRTAATATALMIGLALVVAVNSLGSSFLKTISDEFDRSFARDLTVQPTGFAPGQGPQQTIARGLRDRLARIGEAAVVARERFVFTPDLPGPTGKTTEDGLLFGFEPIRYERVDTTQVEGAPRKEAFRRLAEGEVSVGKAYAEEKDLEVGDSLKLQGPSGSRRARVAGIVETVVFGGQTVGMSLDTMEDVYGVTADSQIALKASSEEARPALRRKVERIVREDYPNLSVLSNEELKADVEAQVNEQFGIFYAIVGVAIFASLFGIINTLTMSVIERTREIGVLRALGASRWQVRRSIAYESLVIGLIGALLGIAVGTGLGAALLQGLSAGVPGVVYRPPVATMVWVGVAGVVLGLVASIIPARRAARLDVIKAISYE
ncbi:MAG: ABC transporter permease [Solirubrobacterales bacterium]